MEVVQRSQRRSGLIVIFLVIKFRFLKMWYSRRSWRDKGREGKGVVVSTSLSRVPDLPEAINFNSGEEHQTPTNPTPETLFE